MTLLKLGPVPRGSILCLYFPFTEGACFWCGPEDTKNAKHKARGTEVSRAFKMALLLRPDTSYLSRRLLLLHPASPHVPPSYASPHSRSTLSSPALTPRQGCLLSPRGRSHSFVGLPASQSDGRRHFPASSAPLSTHTWRPPRASSITGTQQNASHCVSMLLVHACVLARDVAMALSEQARLLHRRAFFCPSSPSHSFNIDLASPHRRHTPRIYTPSPPTLQIKHSMAALLVLALLLGTALASSQAPLLQKLSLLLTSPLGPDRLANPHCAGDPFCTFNDWVNAFIFSDATKAGAIERFGPSGAHYLLTYLRDLMAGSVLYYVTAGLWHVYIYQLYGDYFFIEQGFEKPSAATIKDQIQLAQGSMFLYAALPVLAEWFVEKGWTVCYYYIEDIGGWSYYLAFTLLYMSMVEVGVYWMHRTLHENKTLYKYIHGLHHKYNKPSTLSPWASVAFNPIDGILQASPYVVCLFIVPCHYLTHVALVFFTAVWATNIHDAMDGDTEPVMGSKYHTMHHTHYHYNFGQFFIFADWMFGTLRVPEPRAAKAVRRTEVGEEGGREGGRVGSTARMMATTTMKGDGVTTRARSKKVE